MPSGTSCASIPWVGERVLANFSELDAARGAVRHHHERFDGTGYPDRLAADEIPLEARIVAAVDAYSAMTAERLFQPPRSRAAAIREPRHAAGSHLDPTVVAAPIDELDERLATHDDRARPAPLTLAGRLATPGR
jgi:HD-GYP domain-containing protein (c-di-GMP phosphodiesterase class II)